MVVEFSVKVAARTASSVLVSSGSNPPKLKATPPSSSLNSSAVPVNVLHLRRTGISMPCFIPVFALRSLWENCESGERRRRVVVDGELEYLSSGGDRKNYHHCRFSTSRSPPKWKRLATEQQQRRPPSELDLSLIPTFPIQTTAFKEETRRPETPSMYSEESVTTTTFPDSTAGERFVRGGGETTKLLNLFT
ncbi:unnamed protein product [Brassica oleracea var. botrytis]|uniref:Uncharacterized protein n=1 Tax=Brassica oleracea var. oleracea TaxID=109376 RepID=A0A0D3A9K9_BRAOL